MEALVHSDTDENFIALENQMRHLERLVDEYAGCVSHVRTATKVRAGHASK
jgi:hypothetical protein